MYTNSPCSSACWWALGSFSNSREGQSVVLNYSYLMNLLNQIKEKTSESGRMLKPPPFSFSWRNSCVVWKSHPLSIQVHLRSQPFECSMAIRFSSHPGTQRGRA